MTCYILIVSELDTALHFDDTREMKEKRERKKQDPKFQEMNLIIENWTGSTAIYCQLFINK